MLEKLERRLPIPLLSILFGVYHSLDTLSWWRFVIQTPYSVPIANRLWERLNRQNSR
jgi:hypothetical protein